MPSEVSLSNVCQHVGRLFESPDETCAASAPLGGGLVFEEPTLQDEPLNELEPEVLGSLFEEYPINCLWDNVNYFLP
jgi:hypothetical protein